MHKRAFSKRSMIGLILVAVAAAGLIYGVSPAVWTEYREDLIYLGRQHLYLVGVSMALALAVGLPSGVLLSRQRLRGSAEHWMQIFNIGNTLPPMAVLALAMALVGIGDAPAIVALFLASLLPIVRNTYAGLAGLQPALLEAADALGMTPRQRLWRVELPNALPVILTGVRVALALNVGTAPLAFLIGASSYGELIFPGIYLNNHTALLLGAGGTALIALTLDLTLAGLGRLAAARGLA
ncbi:MULTISPECIES: ABC transporter permease [Chromobacterium]|uniref:ABC transporter permease n=1 Tax=Chromobacterium TaxID=535 RepID=UPI000D2FC869|nr:MULTISPECIES: ABC transporter permease [Chromobacterium]PTU64906.1 glycine/betaine ABC transporter permease [Chromobacterium sp. Panama]UJB30669.1 ABC transporter permease [Chromobacterium sp. Beijing]